MHSDPLHTHRCTKFNAGQNREETKEQMNKTVELMAMVTAPGGLTFLIYNARWAFKHRYRPGSLLTASLRSTLQWERHKTQVEGMKMRKEEILVWRQWEREWVISFSFSFLLEKRPMCPWKLLIHNSPHISFYVYVFPLKVGCQVISN